MQRVVFSSDELPEHLDNQARLELWRDLYGDQFGAVDMAYKTETPFSARCEIAQFGSLGFMRFEGTLQRVLRTPRDVAADPRGDFLLGLPRGGPLSAVTQRGREIPLTSGKLILTTNAEPMETRVGEGHSLTWLGVSVPRERLLEVIGGVEDIVSRPIDESRPAIRYLGRHLDMLSGADWIASDPQLLAHVETTLFDLVTLALGAGRDAMHVAQMRGLRAARLHDILTDLGRNFSDPAISPDAVARRLGISARYIHDLHETGITLSERVLELRLQKARAMLSDARNDRLKVSDVAFACGFNEVSYFNRRFRARFGCSPTQVRGGTDPA